MVHPCRPMSRSLEESTEFAYPSRAIASKFRRPKYSTKGAHEGHPQGAPLPIVNLFRLKNRSPRGLFSAIFSELGSNQVVSRVLAQLDAIALPTPPRRGGPCARPPLSLPASFCSQTTIPCPFACSISVPPSQQFHPKQGPGSQKLTIPARAPKMGYIAIMEPKTTPDRNHPSVIPCPPPMLMFAPQTQSSGSHHKSRTLYAQNASFFALWPNLSQLLSFCRTSCPEVVTTLVLSKKMAEYPVTGRKFFAAFHDFIGLYATSTTL